MRKQNVYSSNSDEKVQRYILQNLLMPVSDKNIPEVHKRQIDRKSEDENKSLL